MNDTPPLNALGASAHNAELYRFNQPDPKLLETFPAPAGTWVGSTQIQIRIPEFTSLCPITGQPDYGAIAITYKPHFRCVESKALKLYLMGFRNYGAFHERCVTEIFDALMQVLAPHYLRVVGEFVPRGGIQIWPELIFPPLDAGTSV